MVASESLFLLIKSLDKNEKRYFRLFAGKYTFKSINNYIRLFDEVERQKLYNEEKIKERNPNESFVRNLPVEKHHLYKMILKSLSNYYTAKPVETRIKEMVLYAQILLGKSLFKDFEKQLLKAKKLAYKYEKWLYILEIITLQRKLTRDGVVDVPLSKWSEEEDEILGRLSCEYELRKLNSLASDIIKKSIIRDKHQLKQLQDMLQHPLLQGSETNFSFSAKRYKYNTLSSINRVLGNEAGNYHASVMAEENFLQYPHFMNVYPDSYLVALTNRIISEGIMGKFQHAFDNLKKLKNYSEKNRIGMSDAEFHNNMLAYYALVLELSRHSNNFEQGRDLLPEMKGWLITCKHLLDKQNLSALYLAAANICFIYADYKACSRWLTEIIKDADIKHYREDIQCFARIINVIVQYKMDNIKQLSKVIRSTFRYLLKKKKLYGVEICIINFIRNRLPRKNVKRIIIGRFRQLKADIEHIIKDKNESRVMVYFDLVSWLESEIASIDMIKIIKNKSAHKEKSGWFR